MLSLAASKGSKCLLKLKRQTRLLGGAVIRFTYEHLRRRIDNIFVIALHDCCKIDSLFNTYLKLQSIESIRQD
jgi:hypothetical protein